ncbi:hypothetical protein [Burkholderia plantarii]|uniref:hypothetical protein n=1 Tax=Burkholderia plantarii TaxID=41899 RepID=UPI0018DD236A|nr:hypothetical protein [Burkholderia plantarii]MBI0329084.1 hypothetical protein [Burkholderia plantarii]
MSDINRPRPTSGHWIATQPALTADVLLKISPEQHLITTGQSLARLSAARAPIKAKR